MLLPFALAVFEHFAAKVANIEYDGPSFIETAGFAAVAAPAANLL